ncbi:solute carrier family 25 protein Shawn [Drosophila kikkawai]|uniref:Solute carrier family 25 protein Shawn n=1 Tax=Drosophila kikkawai TaxID=30033 RepID=A0A6P4J1H1_DROKI|nr:solute carrier family 25 member 40 isoform X1 [Drosophila kikkawai]
MPAQLDNQEVDRDGDDPVELATLILKADPRYRIKPMQQVVSALFGGLLTTFVVTPLEVVKTRVQTQHAIRQRPTISKLCYVFHNGLMTHVCRSSDLCYPKSGRIPHSLRPPRGSLDAFLKILCSSGPRGLWAGLSPTLVSALPSTIIYFLTYEYFMNSLSHFYLVTRMSAVSWNIDEAPYWESEPGAAGGDPLDTPKRPRNVNAPANVASVVPYYVPMASGICSRTLVVTAITPIEMVRIKMQSEYMTYSELWQVLRSLIRRHGVLGLWRGWPPTVMRDAPFSGTYWATYEAMKRTFSVTEPSFMFSFLAGAISGAVATLVTMPFDLVTTHTQIELGQSVLNEKSNKDRPPHGKPSTGGALAKPSVFSRLGQIYRRQGARGLYVGVMPRMLRVVPACAIMISTFEYSKSFFFHYNVDLQETAYRQNT